MGNLKKLQIDGVDIQPVVSEYDTYDSNGVSLSNKYATKDFVNSQVNDVSNQITQLNNSANALHTKLGDKNALTTPHNDTTANIIGDIYAARDNMKQSLVNALSEKGVSASTNETIESLISKIDTIEVGSDIPDWYVPTNNYSNTWLTAASRSDKPGNYVVGCSCAVGNDNNIYFVGGDIYSSDSWDSGESTNRVSCYNPITNQWSTKTNYSFATSYAGVAHVNGYIYVSGGYEDWSTSSNKHYRYNIANNSWESRRNMSTVGIGHRYVPVNTNIYAIGGTKDTYLKYDTSANTWSSMTRYLDQSYGAFPYAAAGVYNTSVYIADPETQDCASYNTTSGTWTQRASCPYIDPTDIAVNDPYLFGGDILNGKLHIAIAFSSTSFKYHQCFDISLGSWTSKSTSTMNDLYSGATAAVNGNLYALSTRGNFYCYVP